MGRLNRSPVLAELSTWGLEHLASSSNPQIKTKMAIKRKAVVKNAEEAFGKTKVKVGKKELEAEVEDCEGEDEVEETPALSEEELLAKRENEEKEEKKRQL